MDDAAHQHGPSPDSWDAVAALCDQLETALASGESAPLTAAPELSRLTGLINRLLSDNAKASSEQTVLRYIIANLPHRIFWKDREGRFLGGNDNFLRDLGRTSEADFLGKTDYDMPYPPEQAAWFRRIDHEVMDSGAPRLDIEEEMARPDGVHYLSTSKVPLRNPHGQIVGTLGIYVDITERKRAEMERRRLLERLKEMDRIKTQFFANVSHELRTPLTLILGLADRISKSNPDPALQADLDGVSRNARALLKQVNDLLDVAKLEAGRMAVDYLDVDLARLVRLCTSTFDVLASERGITFEVITPESLPAQLDPAQLQQILTNLLANAFKFSPPGGTVRCLLSQDDGTVRLTVSDSGPGVPEAMRQAVFERFVQVEGGITRRYGGTGLGLAIAREFVELHHGQIGVDDAPEGGARFQVILPRLAPAGASVRTAPLAIVANPEAVQECVGEWRSCSEDADRAPDDGRPLLLVVEDNCEMARYLAETLGGDYGVLQAADGQQGLEMARRHRPDLILSDVMMPRMSGADLVRSLRADATFDDVPIVMLTAKADDELRVQLLRAGAQDYIMKPFAVEELRVRIGNLVSIRRSRAVLQQALDSQQQDLETLAAALSHRHQELHTALDAAEVARHQALQASHMKTNFLRLISHELRTPLTILQLHLQMLHRQQEEVLTPRQQTVVQKIGTAAMRLYDLVSSLLEYARLESGKLELLPQEIDLGELVATVVDELQPLAEARQLYLSVLPGEPPLPWRSDTRLVRLILVNLIGNALKYTDHGGVTVEATVDAQGSCHLSVTDTGPGIPEDKLSEIFEPFAQLEPIIQKHTPGIGLGLALVKDMVHALGGHIEVQSQVGTGSTFRVVLQALPKPAQVAA
jgi:PAS domain S-box-containing protein